MNEIEQNRITTSGQSEISTLKFSKQSDKTAIEKMDRGNYYHWGASREIMEIIRRRNNSHETRRLVEQRKNLSGPGTLRRRYDHQTQRTIFATSRPNKRSREEIADIDAELIRRANRIGGGYQPIEIEAEQKAISKTAIDPEFTRVGNSMRREDRETITEGHRTAFDKLSIRRASNLSMINSSSQ